MLCHGNGDAAVDGCCWVEGQICPLRWKIVNDHVFDHLGTDLGTVDSFIKARVNGKPNQDRAKAQLQGVVYVCSAAIDVLVADSTLLDDRARFEAAWNAHEGYVAQVRPAWARIEQSLGLPDGSYQCSTWRGTGRAQCCWAEDQTTNDSKAGSLHADGVKVRQAGGT